MVKEHSKTRDLDRKKVLYQISRAKYILHSVGVVAL